MVTSPALPVLSEETRAGKSNGWISIHSRFWKQIRYLIPIVETEWNVSGGVSELQRHLLRIKQKKTPKKAEEGRGEEVEKKWELIDEDNYYTNLISGKNPIVFTI